jgi:glycosyltransferase involved in cell wall biosynthesis
MSRSDSQPLVAVIIPVFNARPYLRAAVESVLAQTYQNLELIVIDDGSTDGSVEVLSGITDRRLRIERQANAGKPAALNRAIASTDAEFYAVNDADDLSHPTRLERLVACMQARPHLAGVFSGHDLILGERIVAPQFRAKDEDACHDDIERFRMPGHDPTPMYRLSMVRGFEFDPSLPVAEGLDYILRVGEQYPLYGLGECLYSYRIHPASITKRARDLCQACVWKVLRRACDRRGVRFEDIFGVGRDSALQRPRNKELDNNLAASFIESVIDLRGSGRRMAALRTGLQCSRLHPADPHYHKALAYALMPRTMMDKLRARSSATERVKVPSPAANAVAHT